VFSGIGGVNAPTGSADTLGLVTEFNIIPVPEPSTLIGAATSVLLIAGYAWRRRRLAAA
jgi:hypothetical protein